MGRDRYRQNDRQTDRQSARQKDKQTDKQTLDLLPACTIIIRDILKFKKTLTNSISHFLKKDSKNHNSKTIDPTEFCLAPSEREKLALSELLISWVASFGPQNLPTFPNSP